MACSPHPVRDVNLASKFVASGSAQSASSSCEKSMDSKRVPYRSGVDIAVQGACVGSCGAMSSGTICGDSFVPRNVESFLASTTPRVKLHHRNVVRRPDWLLCIVIAGRFVHYSLGFGLT